VLERMQDAGAVTDRADVPLRRVRADELRWEKFSTNSRPALRPGDDATVIGEPASFSPNRGLIESAEKYVIPSGWQQPKTVPRNRGITTGSVYG
jgi:hypothetical protein